MVALAGLNSRWEAFAQLLTLLVVFIFVLALTYFATRWAGMFCSSSLQRYYHLFE